MIARKLRPDEVALESGDLERFAKLIRKTAGFEIPQARQGDLRRAIARRLAELPSPDPDLLFRKLTDPNDGSEHLEPLLADLTVGETYFFRDRPQMEALENRILPDILERNRHDRSIRIWSAACSSGEEPYSLAILLRRLLPDIDRWKILILATDINRRALAKAAEGSYRSWSFRQTSQEFQARYFSEKESEWEIDPQVRSMVTFRYLNLAQDSYPSLLTDTAAMDLILCRNVLMYFTPETASVVREGLYESLKDQGWLLVGHAEASAVLYARFAVADVPGTVAYRKFRLSAREEDGHATELSVRPDLILLDSESAEQSLPAADVNLATEPTTNSPLDSGALADEGLEGYREYLKARASADQMDFQQAHLHLDASLKQNPLLASAHYLRGLIYQEEGNLEEAVNALRRCIYAAPDSPLGYYALAGALGRLGHRRPALKALQNVTRLLDAGDEQEPIPEADGLTVGRLLKLVDVQRELIGS
ncbi:MAG: hypothetical protein KY429_10240 [Actinobacteria bacterium]|nr:hypothetical protein [Actinomycetota bacterium]